MAAVPRDTTSTRRNPVPPAPPAESPVHRARGIAIGTIQDIIHGSRELADQAKAATNTVRSGIDKIKASIRS